MDELVLQTREALDGRPITQNIFPFQVRRAGLSFAGSTRRLPPMGRAGSSCHIIFAQLSPVLPWGARSPVLLCPDSV